MQRDGVRGKEGDRDCSVKLPDSGSRRVVVKGVRGRGLRNIKSG